MTLILSGIPAEHMAAASSLLNFARTLSGTIAVSFVTTLWSNREALHHVRLTESITAFTPQAQTAFDQLSRAGLQQNASNEFLARLVTSQAYTMASTDLFWLSGCLFIALIALVWLARRPATASATAAE